MPYRILGAGGPEAQRTGNGVRRFPAPPPPKVPPELLALALAPPDPIMHGRPPVAACLGLLDLIGLPTTFTPATYPMGHNGDALPRTQGGIWARGRDLATESPLRRESTQRRPGSSHPSTRHVGQQALAGRSLGGSSHPSNDSAAFIITSDEHQRPKSAHPLSSSFSSSHEHQPPRSRTPPAALATSSSERWLQQRRELGEAKEEVFIGNNLREVTVAP